MDPTSKRGGAKGGRRGRGGKGKAGVFCSFRGQESNTPLMLDQNMLSFLQESNRKRSQPFQLPELSSKLLET